MRLPRLSRERGLRTTLTCYMRGQAIHSILFLNVVLIEINMKPEGSPWLPITTISCWLNSTWRRNQEQQYDMEKTRQFSEEIPPRVGAKLIIIRKQETEAPNLMLNIDGLSTQIELWAVAMFAILLQLGVLVYTGLGNYNYPAHVFGRGTERVNVPLFVISTLGTIVLLVGLLICARVVESSTDEKKYRPLGLEARIVYLQKAEIVNDQSFESFALFANDAKSTITTSTPVDLSPLLQKRRS